MQKSEKGGILPVPLPRRQRAGRVEMGRPPKEPLRELTDAERADLERVARATSERADRVIRAKQLLAVARGASFTAAAHLVGRRNGEAVARLVARFNWDGL